ncbi:MAG: DUF1190 domain-containing protein [Beijerinckiaceae bacterium]
MIKAVVVLVIAGVAGLMAWQAFVGECPGGKVVASESECYGPAGFDITFCRLVFGRAEQVARASGSVYMDQNTCAREWGACLPHASTNGFVPRPAGFCVAGGGDTISRMKPIYRPAHAQR